MSQIPSGLTIHDLDERELLIYRDRMEHQRKSPLITWLLWLFVGVFGGHRYYLGNVGQGIAMTLTLGGLGIWKLIDAFFIPGALRKNEAEAESLVLQELAMMRR